MVTNREAKAKEEVQLAWSSAETKYYTDWAKNTSVNKDDYYGDEVLLTSYTSDTGTVESSVKNSDGKTWTVKYRAKDQNQLYTFLIDENGNVSRKALIELDKEEIVLQIVDGDAIPVDLKATVEALHGEIEWKIEGAEESKVTMTLSEGNIKATLTGIEPTTEPVTVIAECGGKSAKCKVSVKRTTHVSSISINPTETTVNRESTQTITAEVNEGATEILDWEISTPESKDVKIVETNVNTENNTQTITIEILRTATSEEQIIVTAKSPFNETVNASATLTVNVPVTEISITPTTEITIVPSGYMDLIATVNEDATNKTINWTIESSSAENVVSLSTITTQSGNSMKVTAGNISGFATIRATSAVDSTKSITKTITISEPPEWSLPSGDISVSVGDLITPKIGTLKNEKFYVIGIDGTGDTQTLRLLARYCLDTTSSVNAQDSTKGLRSGDRAAGGVIFSSSENENVYSNSKIKEFVDAYANKLSRGGLTLENVETSEGGAPVSGVKGRLMWGTDSRGEAKALKDTNEDILYGPSSGRMMYWLGTPGTAPVDVHGVWVVTGHSSSIWLSHMPTHAYFACRPVIKILASKVGVLK